MAMKAFTSPPGSTDVLAACRRALDSGGLVWGKGFASVNCLHGSASSTVRCLPASYRSLRCKSVVSINGTENSLKRLSHPKHLSKSTDYDNPSTETCRLASVLCLRDSLPAGRRI